MKKIYSVFLSVALILMFSTSLYAGNNRAGAGPNASTGPGSSAGPGPNANVSTGSGPFPSDLEPIPDSTGSMTTEQLTSISQTAGGKACLDKCSNVFKTCVSACPSPGDDSDVDSTHCLVKCSNEFEQCYEGC